MRISKKHKTSLILFLIAIMFAGINVAYAATSSDLHFCQQPGVLRTMKIIGLIISVVKLLLPVIIIITGMVTFAKVVISSIVSSSISILSMATMLPAYAVPTILNCVSISFGSSI